MMSTRSLARMTRRMLKQNDRIDRTARSLVHRARIARSGSSRSIDTYVHEGGEPRMGIYGYGGCDVWAIASAGPEIRRLRTGSLAIYAQGRARFARSDLILQTLDPPNPDSTREVRERLQLEREMFEPVLFEPSFKSPIAPHLKPFPKDVVVLSVSCDLSRTLYRHSEFGYLVDPGGFWLSVGIENAIKDMDQIKWFSKTFRKVGRLSAEESMANLGRIVSLVRSRLGAEVVVLNCLVVDPGRTILQNSLANSPDRTRRREFAHSLTELSRDLEFPVLDVDSVVKGVGVAGMEDFVKFGPPQRRAIGKELVRILDNWGKLDPVDSSQRLDRA